MDTVAAVRSYYDENGGLSRFREFCQGRFGGSAGETTGMACNLPTADSDPVVAGRVALITTHAGYATLMPGMLPVGDLTRFCLAFAESLPDQALRENSLSSICLKNQRRLMGGS